MHKATGEVRASDVTLAGGDSSELPGGQSPTLVV
jgi:hypothetical protein